MSYYTDFLLKFPTFVLCLDPEADQDDEGNRDLACLAVINVLVPGLKPLPLEDTMWTDLQFVTQQQVHAVMHGLPWTRPSEVQVIFREEGVPVYSDFPPAQLSVLWAARELAALTAPDDLAMLRRIEEPAVAAWVALYLSPIPW